MFSFYLGTPQKKYSISNLFKAVSIESNILFDFLGLYNVRIKAAYHFNFDFGVLYPGIIVPLGTDADTGSEKTLNLPVLPVLNVAYRF